MCKEIGERIRKKRKEMHITQMDVQNKTGISTGNLSGIESGRNLPSANALIGLSQILECSIDWILTGKSLLFENDVILDSQEKELLYGFRLLSDDDQDELIGILNMKLNKLQKKRARSAKSCLSNGTDLSESAG